ncbi:unnamed protein product, partial [Laminaria digitata]
MSQTSPVPRSETCALQGCPIEVDTDEVTGRVHDYCSRTHANMAGARGNLSDNNCKGAAVCKVEDCIALVYRDPVTGVESDYCSNRHYVMGMALRSRECIREGCSKPAWVDQQSGDPLDYCGSRCAARVQMNHLVGRGECSLPGCIHKCFIHQQTQEETGYCSEDHRVRATGRMLVPNPEPFVERTFRGGTTSATDFELSVLTKRHPEYLPRKEQFMNEWMKPTENGVSVMRIFKIKVPEDIRRRNSEYTQRMSSVQRRFHGTSCSDACTFFVNLRGGPCGEPTCNVCNICTKGFKLDDNTGATARRLNFPLRYGDGLYFSSVSGKANDYAEQSEKTSPAGKAVRCMFMADVAMTNVFRTFEYRLDPDNQECPPPGYDAVIGEVGPNLNYDEVVVYNEEA